MTVLEIQKSFPISQSLLFNLVTQKENVVQWWCPKGVTLGENDLNFSVLGPWWFTLIDPQGGKHRVEGEVLAIDPPNSVEFSMTIRSSTTGEITQDTRVRFDVEAETAKTSTFRLRQTGLSAEEIAPVRDLGWATPMQQLEKLVQSHSINL